MKRGSTGVPMYLSVARFAGVVPLLLLLCLCSILYCADAFEIQRWCWLELSLVVFRMARPHNTYTHTSTVHSYHKTKALNCGYCTMAATAAKLTV